ncbi:MULTISPECIES: hypothetical protein [Sphingobacterium]|uniref:hypothetical protein n=1 Tax=Sphingobacterium TaxID=28453 RepID=UPI0013D9805D|nr:MULTISPECIES: hypothetical protein [unclassified Sphingobacterium]
MKAYLIAFSLLSCFYLACIPKKHESNSSNFIDQIYKKINTITEGDTLDLNPPKLSFDKIIILSHENNTTQLKTETSIPDDAKQQPFDLNQGNWAIIWIKDSSIIDKIEFSSEKLMFNNIVNGDGFKIIKRKDLKKILIINNSGDKFLNSDKKVLDTELLN